MLICRSSSAADSLRSILAAVVAAVLICRSSSAADPLRSILAAVVAAVLICRSSSAVDGHPVQMTWSSGL